MDQSTLVPALGLFTLLVILGYGVMRFISVRRKQKRDGDI